MSKYTFDINEDNIRRIIQDGLNTRLKEEFLTPEEIREKIYRDIGISEIQLHQRENINTDNADSIIDTRETVSDDDNRSNFSLKMLRFKQKLIDMGIYRYVQPFAKAAYRLVPNGFKIKPDANLDYLLSKDDREFVFNSYMTVLNREPDEEGLNQYLNQLRNLRITKLQALGGIRFSKEGKYVGKKIPKLRVKYYRHIFMKKIYKIPLFGYILQTIKMIICFPKIYIETRRTNQLIFTQNDKIIDYIESKSDTEYKAFEKKLNEVFNYVDEVSRIKQETQIEVTALLENLNRTNAKSKIEIESIIQSMNKAQNIMKTELSDMTNNIEKIRESMKIELSEITNNAKKAQEDMKLESSQLSNNISKIQTDLNLELSRIVQNINNIEKVQHDMTLNLADVRNETMDSIEKIIENNNQISTKTNEELMTLKKVLKQYKNNLLANERRVTILLDHLQNKYPDKTVEERHALIDVNESEIMDALYVSFEDIFRGTREEIKDKQKIYLNYINHNEKLIDVGCGRGEWLELLRESNISAVGVDLNQIMITRCKEMDLDVQQCDAYQYLKNIDSCSIGAITGFHIVEHLQTNILVKLFDEAFRVLKPGGVLIFETPNPENMIVGACNFYFDPTHKNPIPPVVLQYFAEARGFSNCEILRLSPYGFFTNNTENLNQLVKDLFDKEQEYALIAYKN